MKISKMKKAENMKKKANQSVAKYRENIMAMTSMAIGMSSEKPKLAKSALALAAAPQRYLSWHRSGGEWPAARGSWLSW